ncbi:MAG: ABC transporter ATP-binding protein [Elusimicrobia bacterium]|nr:ABC transporter ATP-binding protein [Elusimicrobiota bacterium]
MNLFAADRSYLRQLAPYLKPHAGDFAVAALSMAVVAGLSSISIGLVKFIIDQIFIEKDIEMLADLAWLAPTLFFFKSVFSYFLNFLVTKIGHAVARDIRDEAVSRFLLQDHAFHAKNKSADLLSRATNDIAAVSNMVMNAPLYVVRDGLTVIFLLGLIVYLNSRFALAIILTIPLFWAIFLAFTASLRRVTGKAQELIAGLYASIAEAIYGLSIIKIFLFEDAWGRRFGRQNQEYYKAMVKYQKLTALSPSLMEFLSGIVITMVLWWGGLEVIRGFWSAGDFMAFLGAAFAAYQPIKHLSQVNPIIQLGISSWKRVLEVKNAPISIGTFSAHESGAARDFEKDIVFNEVVLTYPDGRTALFNVNLTVKRGEILGIAGPSGSGKSSLAMMIARFYDPAKGSILIDGADIRSWNVRSLRRLVAFVTQEAFLFDDTIEANIAVADSQADKDDIIAAAQAANAMEFIQRLPDGFRTHVGERGYSLSAGQRQRIAIARAILKKPQILILDEATSNLDLESEEYVLSALNNLLIDKTAIVISHRIQTLGNTRRIVVLEKGKIVEETSYSQLCAGTGGRLSEIMGT